MQRTLTITALGSIAKRTAIRQQVAAPSSIASSSTFASRLYHKSAECNAQRRKSPHSSSRLASIGIYRTNAIPSWTVASREEFATRKFSTGTILRPSEDPKDKTSTSEVGSNKTHDINKMDASSSSNSIAGSSATQTSQANRIRPSDSTTESESSSDSKPDTAPTSPESASTFPPKLPEDHPVTASNATSSSKPLASDQPTASPSSWLDQIRNKASSLPSFDALTSSQSLSTLVSTASSRTSDLATSLRGRLSHLFTQYNTYSGYSTIEKLKSRIVSLEQSLETKRTLASTAKTNYLDSVRERSSSQRETNDLLSRKNSWTESDLSRYTELLRKEHAVSQQEKLAEQELERTEGEVQKAFDELMKAVMVRYHEEQIWSDRMRGWSTYGSLMVAGLNAVLFIMAILVVEPYKRKKLAETFEKRLVAAEIQSRELILQSVDGFQKTLDAALTPAPAATPAAEEQEAVLQVDKPEELIPPPAEAQEGVDTAEDVASTRPIQRQEEERLVFASTVGVVVGAALSLIISACWS